MQRWCLTVRACRWIAKIEIKIQNPSISVLLFSPTLLARYHITLFEVWSMTYATYVAHSLFTLISLLHLALRWWMSEFFSLWGGICYTTTIAEHNFPSCFTSQLGHCIKQPVNPTTKPVRHLSHQSSVMVFAHITRWKWLKFCMPIRQPITTSLLCTSYLTTKIIILECFPFCF